MKSSIRWLKTDRREAKVKLASLGFTRSIIANIGIPIARVNISEWVMDLCICSKASISGIKATKPTIKAFLTPRIGDVRVKGTAKCTSSSGIANY